MQRVEDSRGTIKSQAEMYCVLSSTGRFQLRTSRCEQDLCLLLSWVQIPNSPLIVNVIHSLFTPSLFVIKVNQRCSKIHLKMVKSFMHTPSGPIRVCVTLAEIQSDRHVYVGSYDTQYWRLYLNINNWRKWYPLQVPLEAKVYDLKRKHFSDNLTTSLLTSKNINIQIVHVWVAKK